MNPGHATDAAPRPRSSVDGLTWPPVLLGQAATLEVLQAHFRESERWAPERIAALQRGQVDQLAAHAHAQSAFWRARLDAAGYGSGAGWWNALPILTRVEAQAAGAGLRARSVPPSHGGVGRATTTGSTGTPLEIAKTELALLFWKAITVRDSLWHRRDLRGKLAAIRVGAERQEGRNWGDAYEGYDCGPGVSFDAREDVDLQLDWLVAERPQILLTHPSNLRALVIRSQERGCTLPSLCEARTYSERLPADLRDLVQAAWGVPLSDLYSANEIGYVALQCPQSGLYHVQSEDVLVEVIGDDGHPCATGESGRVVATSLHNFATPLLRYDLGDFATVGGPCGCGRTLPTLEAILGRSRNMMRLPGGRTAWPGFPLNALVKLRAIRQLKMIQHSLEEIEVQMVLSRALTPGEETTLADAVRTRLRHPFHVRLTAVERIAYGAGHKREDFECRVA
jgi:phenylacetate-CoA ligase